MTLALCHCRCRRCCCYGKKAGLRLSFQFLMLKGIGRSIMKPIRPSGHARDNMLFRGASEEEVVEAIRTEIWEPAEKGRQQCRRNYVYNAEWHGKIYASKQVLPIFVEEAEEIVVVTVYVYYF